MLMLDAQTWIRFGVWMLVGKLYIFLRMVSNMATACCKYLCTFAHFNIFPYRRANVYIPETLLSIQTIASGKAR